MGQPILDIGLSPSKPARITGPAHGNSWAMLVDKPDCPVFQKGCLCVRSCDCDTVSVADGSPAGVCAVETKIRAGQLRFAAKFIAEPSGHRIVVCMSCAEINTGSTSRSQIYTYEDGRKYFF